MSDRSESTNLQERETVAQDSLEEKKLRFEREKEKWRILSNILTVLITVGIGTYGVAHINNVYQERQLKREQILKEKEIEVLEKKAAVERQKAEMQYLGQFLKHALEDAAERRLRFAEYFAKLTVSPDLQQKWEDYHAILLENKEKLDEKEGVLFSSGGLVSSEEKEQLIRDVVTLRSKVNSLPKPQEKISEEVIGQTIFKIRCSSSVWSDRRTETTGFRLEGKKGIITALHAVVGYQDISAVGGEGGEIYFKNLQLSKADIDHDIALLSSEEDQRIKLNGLPAAGPRPSYERLYLIGYPLSLPRPVTGNINIRIPPITKLFTLLPSSIITRMKERDSPSVEVNVLLLEGTALPGQSGAPILNGENKVVGIINGGLQVGTGISWAIPLEDIKFQPVAAIRDELARLSKMPNSGALF